jgi:hypothetical protein
LLTVSSKFNSNFVLSNNGFLHLDDSDSQISSRLHFSHDIKKKYFSFSVKNELQKFIIKRYLKISSSTTYINEIEQMDNVLIDDLLFNERHSFLKNLFVLKQTNFSLFSTDFYSSLFTDIQSDIWDFENYENSDYSFFIKKIKFKPGYMTFWRESRSTLKEIMNLNFRYQYRLTNYINKLNKLNRFSLFINNEMSLHNILVRSRFVFDWETALIFIKNGIIWVNGLNWYRTTTQLYVGDLIQLTINLKYYISYRWYVSWIEKKKLKLKSRTKKKTYSFDERRRQN